MIIFAFFGIRFFFSKKNGSQRGGIQPLYVHILMVVELNVIGVVKNNNQELPSTDPPTHLPCT